MISSWVSMIYSEEEFPSYRLFAQSIAKYSPINGGAQYRTEPLNLLQVLNTAAWPAPAKGLSLLGETR